MKKVIIFLFFVSQFIIANGQTVNIICPSGADCFSVTPCSTPNTYLADINDGTRTLANGYSREVQWTASGAKSSQIPSGDNSSLSVTWDNQPNTTANFVTLRVKYTKSTSDTLTVFAQKAVTVKFIAPITQMSINGSATGNSGTVSCGTQPVTISVPTPTTNPASAITYTWILPSGWTGSSTSNTIVATPDAGTAGAITVQARRNDVLCNQQSFLINVTRPLVGTPTITAEWPANDFAQCIGEFKQFRVDATDATIFSWAPITTGTLYYTSSQSIFALLNAKTTLTATVNNACNVPKTTTKVVYAGAPTIETATVNGQPQSIPNFIMNPCLLNMWTNEIGVTYNWQIMNGTGSIYYNGQNQIGVYAYPFVQIQGSITNRCGATSTTFYLYNIGGGYYRMTSPNPTTSTVSIDVTLMNALKKVTLVSNDRHGIVRMYNANGSLNGNTHRNNNDLSFDVANLPRGLYYLNFVFDGNKTFTEQIVLE